MVHTNRIMAPRYQAPLQHATVDGESPALFRPRLYLFADRLTIAGWGWRGRHRREVPLDQVSDVVVTGTNRLLLLMNGRDERITLTIADAAVWRDAILAHRDVGGPGTESPEINPPRSTDTMTGSSAAG